MLQTTVEYVEQTADGGWRLSNSRVSFDSVIHGYWDGRSPEAIAEEFPPNPISRRQHIKQLFVGRPQDGQRLFGRQWPAGQNAIGQSVPSPLSG